MGVVMADSFGEETPGCRRQKIGPIHSRHTAPTTHDVRRGSLQERCRQFQPAGQFRHRPLARSARYIRAIEGQGEKANLLLCPWTTRQAERPSRLPQRIRDRRNLVDWRSRRALAHRGMRLSNFLAA